MYKLWDCALWIESEGSLQNESQQFGPWIKAALFVSTRRNMVKVPGFFTSRKSNAVASTCKPARKPLVVVVRSGKPSPKVVRPDKESASIFPSANIAPEFQELNMENIVPQESVDATNLGSSNLTDFRERIMQAGVFEEVIEDIDKDIRKFDLAASNNAKNRACLGKENIPESPSIQDSIEGYSQARAQLNPSLSHAPLGVISNLQNRSTHAEGTWKRMTRTETGTNTIMTEAVGEKRLVGETECLPELPKKRKVSQAGTTKKKILAAAGLQPCQKQ